jgi:hypothetical protein
LIVEGRVFVVLEGFGTGIFDNDDFEFFDWVAADTAAATNENSERTQSANIELCVICRFSLKDKI